MGRRIVAPGHLPRRRQRVEHRRPDVAGSGDAAAGADDFAARKGAFGHAAAQVFDADVDRLDAKFAPLPIQFGAQRGQALRHGEIPLVLTHAPATLLRTPSAKASPLGKCASTDAA